MGAHTLLPPRGLAPRPSYCNSSRHQRYSLKDLLLASGHKGHYHPVSQPPAMPCPLHPATSSSKRTTACITEDRTTVPQYQGTHCPRTSYYTYLHLHNHSALGPWPTHGRNVWLRSPHSPQCPARLNTVTGVAIQELPRTETRPISFGPCQRSTRSLQLLQYTGHSGISPTQRAAMARASDLTWGSDQKPQKLLCFGFHITTTPTSATSSINGKKHTFSSEELKSSARIYCDSCHHWTSRMPLCSSVPLHGPRIPRATPTSVHGPPSDGSLANGGDLAPPCVCVTQWKTPSLLTSPVLNSKGGNVLDLSFDEETVVSSHSFCSDFPRNACEGVIIDPSTCWLTAHLHRAGRAAPRRSQ